MRLLLASFLRSPVLAFECSMRRRLLCGCPGAAFAVIHAGCHLPHSAPLPAAAAHHLPPASPPAGTVRVNGREMELGQLQAITGFVPQDDIVHEVRAVQRSVRCHHSWACAPSTRCTAC